MDSLDLELSSLSISAASREGSSPTDEEGRISFIAAMARDAAVLFHSRKYAECVDILLQLSQKKQNDPKVLHNIAISEYLRDGCSDPKKLLELLNNVKTRSEELAHTTAEQANAGGNKVASGFIGTGAMSNQVSSTSSKSVVYADEFGSSVASLNMAVIWFHLHEYNKAMEILEPLYQNIGPIDESVALQICLLLLDAALASNDALKSADLIKYLDKFFNVGLPTVQGDNGSLGQQQSSLKSSSFQASSMDTIVTDSASENSLSRTLSEEPIDYDNLFSRLDISGGDKLQRPSSDLFQTSNDRSILSIDLKLRLQLCKIQFLLLTRNYKPAKREVKEAMNMARGRDSSTALLLKSHLEYALGNPRKAIKLLMASSNGIETGISSLFNNNFGCIYYQLGKYHTSNVFYRKALSNSFLSLRKEKPRKLLSFSQDKSLLITYNCGMHYLVCGKPILAARCFHKASSVFYDRPLLWLRIAECCVMALKNENCKSEITINVIGTGKWRRLLVEDGISKSRSVKSVENQDDKEPNLSMLFARQCLVNALYLLESSPLKCLKPSVPTENEICEADPVETRKLFVNGGDGKEQKGGTSLNDLLMKSISDYEENRKKDNQMIKEAVLANMGYVELELENPLKALSTATSLLNIPECSRMYAFLGRVYAAEALCLLNRPKEAAQHLSVYMSAGANKFELPYREDECEQWRERKTGEIEDANVNNTAITFLNPEQARGTLYVNLAAMSAVQGDLDEARQFAKQALSAVPESREAVVTAVYIDMKLGKTQDAVAKLKQSRNLRFVNSKLSLNKSAI